MGVGGGCPRRPLSSPARGRAASTGAASRARPGRYFGPTRPSGPYTPRYGSTKPSRRQLTTWAVTAESFACHDCPRRHAAPSSSGHGRSPGDHPSWLGLRPRRRLRQRATEGRPRQRRRATRTPPRHGTAATCALASFLVVVVQRGGRRFESCSYRQGGQCLAGRSPSPGTLLFAPLSPCACQPSISSTRSSDLGAPGRRGRDGVVRPGRRRGPIRQRACSCQITGKRTAPRWRCSRRQHPAMAGDLARERQLSGKTPG